MVPVSVYVSLFSSDWMVADHQRFLYLFTDVGKVLVGINVPDHASQAWEDFVKKLGYPYQEETNNV